jgi:predicted transcriptional regulator
MTVSSLGPLEKEVMDCLWPDERKAVREVHRCLKEERDIAYTTVMTVMNRLTDKGFLTRERQGRAYIYSPRQTRKQAIRKMVGGVLESFVDQFGEEAVVAFADESKRRARLSKK